MASNPETPPCPCTDSQDSAQSAYTSLHYQFGMLLGVADFETEQAYHRAKMRLHNQWLHGAGVVRGFGVEASLERGELRVHPGLAIDALGRELHLDADACLNIAAWFDAHRNDPGFAITRETDKVTFDAHVVLVFKTCLTRPVPALAEACEGSGVSTSFSRVFETVEILLRPGRPAPAAAPPYHRLRLLLGLDSPRAKAGGGAGELEPADVEVLAAPRNVDSFRRFAALDEIDLQPPEAKEFPVLLATLSGIQLTTDTTPLKLAAVDVDVTVRPTLVATSAIQEWGIGGDFPGNAGPFAIPGSVSLDLGSSTLKFQVTSDLESASITPSAFSLTAFDPAASPGWSDLVISSSAYDPSTRTVKLQYSLPTGTAKVLRLVARGTGPTPLLGAGFSPLNNGQDFVFQKGI